ncbi:MAG: VOC family protein [Jatrophihabitans sp.]|uniref:VOC family protein n=1 Tax=Jatrophihabitans sp. TaxID=1932789 RepID=UPI00390D3F61
MPMSLRFEIFPADLNVTADFYTRVLAFELVVDRRDGPDPYLALRRDSVRVGVAGPSVDGDRRHRRPPTGVELVLEVDDVVTEHERVRAAGWTVDEDLTDRPWGLRDFRLLDPDGYYLRITERARR